MTEGTAPLTRDGGGGGNSVDPGVGLEAVDQLAWLLMLRRFLAPRAVGDSFVLNMATREKCAFMSVARTAPMASLRSQARCGDGRAPRKSNEGSLSREKAAA